MEELKDSMPLAAMTIGDARQFIGALISEKLKTINTSAPITTPSDIMNADNALAYLHELGYFISKNSLYNLTHLGKVPCQRIGKRLSFSRQALATWVADNAIQKKAAADAATASLALAQSARRKK